MTCNTEHTKAYEIAVNRDPWRQLIWCHKGVASYLWVSILLSGLQDKWTGRPP